MKRFSSLFGAVALGILTTTALYGQAGGAPAAGGAQAGAQGGVQPGAVPPAVQPGAVQPGAVQPGAVQPGVQAGARVGVQPGAQAGIQAQTGMNFSGVRQNPWFNPQLIQKALRLNEQQIAELNKSYAEYWNRYNRDMRALGRNLTDQQRMQRLQELEGSFNRDFSVSANAAFADPIQRQRFNQLALQYRGFGAFNDPTLQQTLNLTPQQRTQLTELNNAWNQEIARAGSEFRVGDSTTSTRLRDLRNQYNKRLSAIFNDQQRQVWGTMTGEPFDFPADVFFQTNINGKTGTQVNPPVVPQTSVPGTPATPIPQTTAPQVPKTTAPQVPQTTAPQVPQTTAPQVPPTTPQIPR